MPDWGGEGRVRSGVVCPSGHRGASRVFGSPPAYMVARRGRDEARKARPTPAVPYGVGRRAGGRPQSDAAQLKAPAEPAATRPFCCERRAALAGPSPAAAPPVAIRGKRAFRGRLFDRAHPRAEGLRRAHAKRTALRRGAIAQWQTRRWTTCTMGQARSPTSARLWHRASRRWQVSRAPRVPQAAARPAATAPGSVAFAQGASRRARAEPRRHGNQRRRTDYGSMTVQRAWCAAGACLGEPSLGRPHRCHLLPRPAPSHRPPQAPAS